MLPMRKSGHRWADCLTLKAQSANSVADGSDIGANDSASANGLGSVEPRDVWGLCAITRPTFEHANKFAALDDKEEYPDLSTPPPLCDSDGDGDFHVVRKKRSKKLNKTKWLVDEYGGRC